MIPVRNVIHSRFRNVTVFYNSMRSNLWNCGRFLHSGSITRERISLASRDTQDKGEQVTREASFWRRVTLLHENCANAIPRIKLPKSFPFDPLQELPLLAKPPRSPLPSRLWPPSLPWSHLLHLDLSPPFSKSQYSCRQCWRFHCTDIAVHPTRRWNEIRRETSHAIRPSRGAPD